MENEGRLSHVFVHCEVSLFWQKLFREAGVNWEIPEGNHALFCHYYYYLVLGRKPKFFRVGTFWVWDAHSTSVFFLFPIYLGALHSRLHLGALDGKK